MLTPDGKVAPSAKRIRAPARLPKRRGKIGHGLLRLEIQKLLIARGWSWQRLADEIKVVCGVEARPVVYGVRQGKKVATPHAVEQFVAALRPDAQARQRMHVAAAVDYGFKIGG